MARKSIIMLRFALAVATLTALVACGGGAGGRVPIGDTGFTITSVVTTDRFPPDCQQDSQMCKMAGEGSQYLVIWLLDTSESSDPVAGTAYVTDRAGRVGLAGGPLPRTAYVTDSSGARYNLGDGLVSGRWFLAQKLPMSASGFTLNVPGVEPLALGK